MTPGSPIATYSRFRIGVVHDDIRHARQRQALQHFAAVAVKNDEVAAVGCAEEPPCVEPESVRTGARYLEGAPDCPALAVDHDDLCRLLDVGVDNVSLRVVDRPARPA